MKKTLLFSSRSLLTAALFFCAASVVSCQKEETAGAAPSCAAIRLTAEPAEFVRTKSETDVAYASRFVEGDAIGLFAVIRSDAETQAYRAASGNYIQNAKFVRQADGSWREEGSKSYYMEQGQVMDLYAYYPYAENADPTALVYDASVAEADFMTARTPGFSERDGEIRLVFRHKLALAEAFVADADKLADYAVTVQDVRTKAVFSLAAAAQDAEMQSVDAKTASVAMTRCGNAFPAGAGDRRRQGPAEGRGQRLRCVRLYASGQNLAGRQSGPQIAGYARFRQSRTAPQLLRRIAGRDALYPRFESLRRVG